MLPCSVPNGGRLSQKFTLVTTLPSALRLATPFLLFLAATCGWSQTTVMVESRTGGQNYSAYLDGGITGDSTLKSSAPGITAGIGSRYANSGTAGTSPWFQVSPTLTNGNIYSVEITHGGNGSFAASANLVMNIALTNGIGLPASTTVFDRTVSNAWEVVGTLILNAGTNKPIVRFTYASGTLANTSRLYADAVRFVPTNLPDALWVGTGTDDNWSTTSNWSSAPTLSGKSVVFSGAVRPTPNLDTDYSVTNLTFLASASPFILGSANGNTLTLAPGAGIINNSASTQTITHAIGLTSGNHLDATSGNLVLSGAISGTGGSLTRTGTRTLTLSGNNTFSGPFTNSASNLRISHPNALGAGGPGNETYVIAASTSRLELDPGITVTGETIVINGGGNNNGALQAISGYAIWAGDVVIGPTPGTRIGAASNATLEISGAISGTNNFIIRNGFNLGVRDYGTIVLSGASTYTSELGLYCGFLRLTNGHDRLPPASRLVLGLNSTDFNATFDLNGYDQSLAGIAIAASAIATNQVIANSSTGRDSTLTLGTGGGTNTINTYDGFIKDTLGAGTRKVAVSVTGGSQTFTAVNTYTGPTTVSGGILTLSTLHAGGGTFSPVTGGTLGVTVALAGDEVEMSTLSLGVTATDTTTNAYDLGSFGNPPTTVIRATNFTAQGTNYVNVTGRGLTLGLFSLIRYETGAGLTNESGEARTDIFVTGSLPNGVQGYVSNNVSNLSVDLVVTVAPVLVWTGKTNNGTSDILTGEWNIGGTSNWINELSLDPSFFVDGSAVKFTDTGATNVVTLTTNVSPFTLTVSNASLSYLFTNAAGSTNKIQGASTLIKNGSGILTLAVASNLYSGPTLIQGGTLKAAAWETIPHGTGRGNVTNLGTLDLGGFSQTINGLSGTGLITNSATALITNMLTVGNANSSGVFSGSIQETPGFGLIGLTKTGNGIQTLSGASAYSGPIVMAGGTLLIGHDTALGNGPITVGGGVFSSENSAPRTFGNNLFATTNITLGATSTNGAINFLGVVDLGGALRNLTCNSDVTFGGGSANGNLDKLGPGTMTLRGVHRWGFAEVKVLDGLMILDGAIVTNSASVRPDGNLTNGLARMVLTNGAVLIMTSNNVNLRVGFDGNKNATNILDVSGTIRLPNTVTSGGSVVLGSRCARAALNLLPGGDIEVRSVKPADVSPFGESEFNFAGGILRVRALSVPFMQGLSNVFVRAGGANIDTAGADVTLTQNLLDGGGAGGLVKLGTGTLTLAGTNTFTGTTVVSNGTVALPAEDASNPAKTSTVEVRDGTGLNVYMNNPATVLKLPGLVLGNGSGAIGATLNVNLGGWGNPPAAVVQAPSLMVWRASGNAVTLRISAIGLTLGQFPLIKYNGSIGGDGFDALNLVLPGGVAGNLVNNTDNQSVDVLITGVEAFKWTGATDANWDFATANWELGGIGALFADGGPALFNDDAVGLTDVVLATNVAPSSIIVSNVLKNYSFRGSSKIQGTANLVKQGTGLLMVNTTNDFTGSVSILGGTLGLTNDLAFGKAPSVATPASIIINGGTLLAATGAGTLVPSSARGMAIGPASGTGDGTIEVASGQTLATQTILANHGAGQGRLVKNGPGILRLSASTNTFSGGFMLNDGTIQLNSALPVGSGLITINSGTLMANGSARSLTNDTLINGDFNVSGLDLLISGTANLAGGTRTITVTNSVNFTLNGIISNGGLVKKGTNGTLTLGSNNTFDGAVTISEGIVAITQPGALGSTLGITEVFGGTPGNTGTDLQLAGGIVVSNETLIMTSTNLSGGLRTRLTAASGSNSWTGPITLNGNSINQFNVGAGASLSIEGAINGGAVGQQLFIRGTGFGYLNRPMNLDGTAVYKHDIGTWTINTAGNVWGDTIVADGTLRLGVNNALPITTRLLMGFTTFNRSYLDLNGYNQEVASLGMNGTPPIAVQTITNSSSSVDSTFTFNGTNVSTFTGIFADSGGTTGKLNLVIQSGVLVLGTTNTYGGVTDIRNGTLALSSTGQIARTTQILLGSSGILDVSAWTGAMPLQTFQELAGNGLVLGSLVANGTVKPSASPSVLSISSNLALLGTTYMELGPVPACNSIAVSNQLTLGGTLILTNTGSALKAGDTFHLFAAGTYAGAFTNVTLTPSLDPGLAIDVQQLNASGTMVIATAPVIIQHPQSQTNGTGGTVSFTVQATGNPALTYQWYHATTLVGGNTNQLFLSNLTTNDAGLYYVVVSNGAGAATSSNALLTITNALAAPDSVAIFPLTNRVYMSNGLSLGSAAYSATATGTEPVYYTWYANSNFVSPLATGTNLTITPTCPDDNSYYTVIASNLYGMTTSTVPAYLEVRDTNPPVFLADLASGGARRATNDLVQGTPLNLGVSLVANCNPATFQWYFNSTNALGSTSNQFTVASAGLSQAGEYSVVVTNNNGALTSAVLVLNVQFQLTNAIQLSDSNTFGLQLLAEPGWVYTLTAKTNLNDPTWVVVTNITATTNALIRLQDFAATNQLKFYRVGSTPAP